MTKLIYVVKVRGLIPESLPRKVIEAHAEALKSSSHSRYGSGLTTSRTVSRKGQWPRFTSS